MPSTFQEERIKIKKQIDEIQDYFAGFQLSKVLDDAINLAALDRKENCFGTIIKHLVKFEDGPKLEEVRIDSVLNDSGALDKVLTLYGRLRGSNLTILDRISLHEASKSDIEKLCQGLSKKLPVCSISQMDIILQELELNLSTKFLISLAYSRCTSKIRDPFRDFSAVFHSDEHRKKQIFFQILNLESEHTSITSTRIVLRLKENVSLEKILLKLPNVLTSFSQIATSKLPSFLTRTSTAETPAKKTKEKPKKEKVEVHLVQLPNGIFNLPETVNVPPQTLLDWINDSLSKTKSDGEFEAILLENNSDSAGLINAVDFMNFDLCDTVTAFVSKDHGNVAAYVSNSSGIDTCLLYSFLKASPIMKIFIPPVSNYSNGFAGFRILYE